MPSSARAARQGLTGEAAVLDPDRREIRVTVRCRAARSACRGQLSVIEFGGVTLTAERPVALRPGRPVRLSLPLLPGQRRTVRLLYNEEATVTLVRRGRSPLHVDLTVRVRPTCRSGQTLVLSPHTRVFVLPSYASFACARPGGRPLLLAPDSDEDDFVQEWSSMHRIAGRYVAFVRSGGTKCLGHRVVAIDVITRRQYAVRSVNTTLRDAANGCDSTGRVGALVLSASGAIAWTETAGDDGKAQVRALSGGGDRILDVASDIDVTSLRLVDGTLSWLRGAERLTAPLG